MKKQTWAYAAAMALAATTAVTVVAVQSAAADDDALGEAIDAILADDAFTASQAGVVVADAGSGEVIYDHNGQMRGIPASNTKLLTSAAAIGLLGGDYTYTTDVASAGTVEGGALGGDAYLRGTGDPTMLAEDYDALAKSIADSGITEIKGDLIADDTAFDAVRLGPEWGWDDLPYYYAAEISPLTLAPDSDYDAGSVIVNVEPGAAEGEAPTVTMTPPNEHVRIDNQATTSAAGGDSSVGFDRALASDTIVVSGEIPADADTGSEWLSVHEPTGYATDVFAAALAEHGVEVTGDVRLGETTPDDAATLAEHESMPLSDLLTPFMKLSNNAHAETLTKTIGREVGGDGGWSAGLAEIESFVAELGMVTDGQRQSDGSGLSRWNNIPPREFINLLLGAQDQDWFDTWYQAQPIACESDRMVGGTLRSRMCDTPAEGNVHAKTGSLTGVSALSGYVTDADGRDLVFSVVTNDFLADSVKDLEDRIAVTLASYQQGDTEAAAKADIPQPDRQAPAGRECSWVKPIAC